MRRPFGVGAGAAAVTCGALLSLGIHAAQPQLSLSVVSQRADEWECIPPTRGRQLRMSEHVGYNEAQ
jgi:hypothetical protein